MPSSSSRRRRPRAIPEGQVGGDDDRRGLVELRDEMERAAALRPGRRAGSQARRARRGRDARGAPRACRRDLAALGLQPVDEVGGVEEARPGAAPDAGRAIAIARCVLPVPVPPTSTTLRWLARKLPEARSRTRPSLIGVSAKVKSAISLRQRHPRDRHLVLDGTGPASPRSRPSAGCRR